MKTGNTSERLDRLLHVREASMEPGHEDREYSMTSTDYDSYSQPQWSPVMKTGNTGACSNRPPIGEASMEPGHEDREYPTRR